MKLDQLKYYLSLGNISIPKMLLFNYKKLNLEDSELILLVYFLGYGNSLEFDFKKFSKEMNMEDAKVLDIINKLQEKGFVDIKLMKNEKGILEEKVLLDGLYQKILMLFIEEETKREETTLFDQFEHEFGRMLSPMEFEIINAWLNDHFTEEIILEALKEAVYNGVSNLRYIDRIIYEWRKKGLKSVSEVRSHNEKFKKDKMASKERVELFDYNWLEDKDE